LLGALTALSALLAWAFPRVRASVLGLVGVVAALALFLPGGCATAIASPPGVLIDPDGTTTCWTFYGATLSGADASGNESTGGLLALLGSALVLASVLLVRRRQRRVA
jgi:LPXTG-motif cell wall-anchored protein